MIFSNHASGLTKAEKLLNILSDGRYHATKELSRRVGHTFAVAKFKLVHFGYVIDKQKHPSKRHQFQYKLLDEPKDV